MKKKLPQKILYDRESEVLSIEVEKVRDVDSDISGNIVVDYDSKGNIVRINVYGFSFQAFRNGRRALQNFLEKHEIPLSVK